MNDGYTSWQSGETFPALMFSRYFSTHSVLPLMKYCLQAAHGI